MSSVPSYSPALDLAVARQPTIADRPLSGESPAEGPRPTTVIVTAPAATRVTPEVREAIIASLHDERGELTRKRRLGELTASDHSRLAELEEYIDSWELQEESASKSDVWSKLDAIAARVVDIGARVERQRP